MKIGVLLLGSGATLMLGALAFAVFGWIVAQGEADILRAVVALAVSIALAAGGLLAWGVVRVLRSG